jgi:hypothetical protein
MEFRDRNGFGVGGDAGAAFYWNAVHLNQFLLESGKTYTIALELTNAGTSFKVEWNVQKTDATTYVTEPVANLVTITVKGEALETTPPPTESGSVFALIEQDPKPDTTASLLLLFFDIGTAEKLAVLMECFGMLEWDYNEFWKILEASGTWYLNGVEKPLSFSNCYVEGDYCMIYLYNTSVGAPSGSTSTVQFVLQNSNISHTFEWTVDPQTEPLQWSAISYTK